MFSFDSACKMAFDYFGDIRTRKGIRKVYESENLWIFFGRKLDDNIVEYGNMPISINKNTGECFLFPLYEENNYNILNRAKEIQVPKQYS